MKHKILFLMPNWRAASEDWMQTTMFGLGDNLKAICVWNSRGERLWNKKVPVVDLTTFKTGATRILSAFLGEKIRWTSSKIILDTINKYEIDTVIVNYGDFALRFNDVWKEKRVRLFVHFHGYDTQLDLRKDNDSNQKYFGSSYKNDILKLSKYSTFIANSKYTTNLLVNDFGVKPAVVKLNYPGVNVPKKIKSAIKPEIQIMHLGRLIDCKSPDRTIRSFELARKAGLKAKLVIVGDGILKDVCEKLRNQSVYKNSIEILGAVSHNRCESLLSATDIYTQHNVTGEKSHQTECLGVSILEAMSYGIPVVSTKSGGIVETVVDGKTGILVNPGDIDGQAKAFLKLGTDSELRKEMGIKGRKRVEKLFSSEIESENLLKIINE